ncbi:MAG TPA: ATP-binding protein [Burkholderiales bacterium]|jgi:nitrogen fixation/metabolism regulation signal transduction histidine kinase|nr:ATP-binding protein [Burkholderiales bacterium]
MKRLLIFGSAIAAVGLFLLATASADTTLFARQYPLLLALNAALAALLAGLVAFQLVAMARRYRARVFGTRLTLRLLLRFAALAVLPGIIVYAVSVQFITRSIESWFDVKVDAALEGGINLGQQAIDQMLLELQNKARAMALDLAERPAPQVMAQLERLRAQAGVQEAVVLTAAGRLVASATEDVTKLVPDLPSPALLRQARGKRGYTSVDAAQGRSLSLRAIVPIEPRALADEVRFVQLRASVPSSFARNAEAVEAAYRDYRELAISRDGLKRIYVVTLTFALLMALFVAVAAAVTQSNRLAEPLATLAQAMQAVARGDFSRRAPVTSRDELGVLTESFNSMTRQLDDARRVVEVNRAALESSKSRLENILANLSAGVLVFDHQLELSISNHGAEAILGAERAAFAQLMREHFLEHGGEPWQLDLHLKGTGKTLHARGAPLPRTTGGGYVLVFDDITQLINAQRAIAWAEVARRLAHEIKNPLTPIQLSAERLQMKLGERLPREDAETLSRATSTIVSQVTALKAMVDDFRDYARLPAPVFAPLDLNRLVSEVLALYEHSPVPMLRRLAPGLPLVWADGTQIRQVIHNLVQNAQDALEHERASAAQAAIEVRTELAGDRVRLAVSDNGIGFPEALMDRIFEPYVTTKPRGTGLGLAIVKKIVDEHHGSVAIENRPSHGASVSVLLPLAKAA